MTPESILAIMTDKDHFTRWMALQIDSIKPGYCQLHYTIRKEMLNGFGKVHGGILFAASDSAFAFACNAHGIVAVAMEVSISFLLPATEGDVIHVEAKEIHLGNKTGLYDIRSTDANGKLISVFKGTSYRTGKEITIEE
ncbi:MAG: hotdog fold thioesterase [Chitinophagaceae bacterium]